MVEDLGPGLGFKLIAFDEADVASELKWLAKEAREVRGAILRMEAYMAAIFAQHARRCSGELEEGLRLCSLLSQLHATNIDVARSRRELVQASAEELAHRYYSDCREIVAALAEANTSRLRCGRPRKPPGAAGGVSEALLGALPINLEQFEPRLVGHASLKDVARAEVAPDLREAFLAKAAAARKAEMKRLQDIALGKVDLGPRPNVPEEQGLPVSAGAAAGAAGAPSRAPGAPPKFDISLANCRPFVPRARYIDLSYSAAAGFQLDSFGKSPFAVMATGRLVRVLRQGRVRRRSELLFSREVRKLRKAFHASRVQIWKSARAGALRLAPLRTVYRRAAGVLGMSQPEGLLSEEEEAEENAGGGGGGGETSAGEEEAEEEAEEGDESSGAPAAALAAGAGSGPAAAAAAAAPPLSRALRRKALLAATRRAQAAAALGERSSSAQPAAALLEGEADRVGGDAAMPPPPALLQHTRSSRAAAAAATSGANAPVPGGVLQGGLSMTAHPPSGRFGRLLKAASTIAKEMEALDAQERMQRFMRLAHEAEKARAVANAAALGLGDAASSSSTGRTSSSEAASSALQIAFNASVAGGGAEAGMPPPAALTTEGWVIPEVKPAQARPNPFALSFWSVTGTGEELGNPAFYYYGTTPAENPGRVRCLWGIYMDVGVARGVGKAAQSVQPPESSSDSEEEGVGGMEAVTLGPRPPLERLRTGIPESHKLGKELGELQRMARKARAALRRQVVGAAESARRSAAVERARLAEELKAAEGGWFTGGAAAAARARLRELDGETDRAPEDAVEGGEGGGPGSSGAAAATKRALRDSLIPKEDTHTTRAAVGAYPHLSMGGAPVEVMAVAVPRETPAQRSARAFQTATAARESHRAARDMSGALSTATRAARLRAGVPDGADPNAILGAQLGASQFEEGGAGLFRRTGLGGTDNLNKLMGWEGKAAREAAGIEDEAVDMGMKEEAEGEGDATKASLFLVRKLTIAKDPYKRNDNAGPRLAVAPPREEGGEMSERELADAAEGVGEGQAPADAAHPQPLGSPVSTSQRMLGAAAASAHLPTATPASPLQTGAGAGAGGGGGRGSRSGPRSAPSEALDSDTGGEGEGARGRAVLALPPPPQHNPRQDAADSAAWWANMSHVPDDEARLMAYEMVQATRSASSILGQWVGTTRILPGGRSGDLNGVALRKAEKAMQGGAEYVSRLSAEAESAGRGYGGGKLCVGDEGEYASRLRFQVKQGQRRSRMLESKCSLLAVQVDGSMAALEIASALQTAWEPPLVVRVCREASAEATDGPMLRNWEKEREKRAHERIAQKERDDLERRRRMGITEEDERIAKIEEERERLEKGQERESRGLPFTDPADLADKLEKERREWEEAMRIRGPEEEFHPGGFQAVVGEDGSLLDWAGTGVGYKLSEWKARYRIRPWVSDLIFTRYLTSQTGQVFKTPEDMYKGLEEMGGRETMRAFKVASEGLPPQGMEATKHAVAIMRKEMQRVEEEKRKAQIAAEQEALRRQLGSRSTKNISALRKAEESKKAAAKARKAEKESAVKAAADAASAETESLLASSKKTAAEALADVAAQLNPALLLDNLSGALVQAKEVYLNFRKDMAEQRMAKNVDLQTMVAKVKARKEAAKGSLEGICNFHFNYGVYDESAWATKQLKAYEEGKPFYFRLRGRRDTEHYDGNMGTPEDPVFLWYERTDDESQMISDVLWAPFDPTADPIVSVLLEKGYQYVTHPAVYKGWGLWYSRGTGTPITAMTMSFDNDTAKDLVRARGFTKVEGNPRSPCVHPEATLYVRANKVRRKIYKAISETLRQLEVEALEREVAVLQRVVEEARAEMARKKVNFITIRGGVEFSTVEEGYNRAVAALERARLMQRAEIESHMAEKAIEFLGLDDKDVTDLSKLFHGMEPTWARQRAQAAKEGKRLPPLRISLKKFYALIDIVRSPITDSLFFFMDASVRAPLSCRGGVCSPLALPHPLSLAPPPPSPAHPRLCSSRTT